MSRSNEEIQRVCDRSRAKADEIAETLNEYSPDLEIQMMIVLRLQGRLIAEFTKGSPTSLIRHFQNLPNALASAMALERFEEIENGLHGR